jgi:hypothetical protein
MTRFFSRFMYGSSGQLLFFMTAVAIETKACDEYRALEICHTMLCIAFLYTYLVTYFGDAEHGIGVPTGYALWFCVSFSCC